MPTPLFSLQSSLVPSLETLGSVRLDDDGQEVISGSVEKMSKICAEFMIRVAKFEELVPLTNKLLSGFQQALEFLRMPHEASKVVESIIKTNETERVKSYLKSGWLNTHESVQHSMKLHTSIVGLRHNLIEARNALNEMECLVDEMECIFHSQFSNHDCEDVGLSALIEATNYLASVGIIYAMIKKDFLMQEMSVNALKMKTTSEELESYTLMGCLRPYINDKIMHAAWKII